MIKFKMTSGKERVAPIFTYLKWSLCPVMWIDLRWPAR